MSNQKCPLGYAVPDCSACCYQKEGLCDYPYAIGDCPGLGNCQKVAAVLDQQLEVPQMYVVMIRKTCQECKANKNQPICISKIGY